MTRESLTQRKCQPCEKTTPALSAPRIQELLSAISGWELIGGTCLRKQIRCKNFMDAVHWIQLIAPIAEAEDHHPDLHLSGYRRLTIELSTHAIGGLSENDFILAAKIDQLLSAGQSDL